ncbi:hypothetical protein ACFQU7_03955 [Pseudoroseomonas wenyumeiae]
MTSEVIAPLRRKLSDAAAGRLARPARRDAMHDPKAIAAAYLDAWNEADLARRQALLAEGWSEDARYADPLMQAEGASASRR